MRTIERTGQFKRDYKRESKGQPVDGFGVVDVRHSVGVVSSSAKSLRSKASGYVGSMAVNPPGPGRLQAGSVVPRLKRYTGGNAVPSVRSVVAMMRTFVILKTAAECLVLLISVQNFPD
jgi:hypothetical protein